MTWFGHPLDISCRFEYPGGVCMISKKHHALPERQHKLNSFRIFKCLESIELNSKKRKRATSRSVQSLVTIGTSSHVRIPILNFTELALLLNWLKQEELLSSDLPIIFHGHESRDQVCTVVCIDIFARSHERRCGTSKSMSHNIETYVRHTQRYCTLIYYYISLDIIAPSYELVHNKQKARRVRENPEASYIVPILGLAPVACLSVCQSISRRVV